MLTGSTLELSWDHEIKNSLEPSLSIEYLGSSSLFFNPTPSTYSFSISHKTYSDVLPFSLGLTTGGQQYDYSD
jgi:hypothetical protein